MALVPVNTTSYNDFRYDTLGNGFDVDGYYGYQCWDLAAELWQNIGFGAGYPQTGPNLYAMECWTVSRSQNAGDKFDLIYNLSDVKRGDCIVLGASALSITGHIAFADEDYNGSNIMNLLGQNQVDPDFTIGHITTVTPVNVSAFLGAFRYKEWGGSPTPTPRSKRKHFPWFIYNNKNNILRSGGL